MGSQMYDTLASKVFIPYGGKDGRVPMFGMFQKGDGNIGFAIDGAEVGYIDSGGFSGGGGGYVEPGNDLNAILQAAFAGAYVAQLDPKKTYTITTPIVISIPGTLVGRYGWNGNGCKISRQIADGASAITIKVPDDVSGAVVNGMYIANFDMFGTFGAGQGNGIDIIHNTNNSWIANFIIENVSLRGFQNGMLQQGSVFEHQHLNCWFNQNQNDGLLCLHGTSGGIWSAGHWSGGGARENGNAGLELGNFGPQDMHLWGCYFVQNDVWGIVGSNGISSVVGCGFEGNGGGGTTGGGCSINNFATFVGCTHSSDGKQPWGIVYNSLGGGVLHIEGCWYTDYGDGHTRQLMMWGGTGSIVHDSYDAYDNQGFEGTFHRNGTFGQALPVETADFTVGIEDTDIKVNGAGVVAVTLPDPTNGAQLGRVLNFKNLSANAVNSASANVVPLVGGAAGTALVAAGAGKWTRLRCNGTAWEIMASG